MTEKAVHAVIEGRVQAVGFRYWTAREAQALSLRGWVRNRRDGTVEVLFAGSETAVDAMLDACREGPPAARVAHVRVQPAEAPDGAGFDYRPTE
jgi:acylphosphatase